MLERGAPDTTAAVAVPLLLLQALAPESEDRELCLELVATIAAAATLEGLAAGSVTAAAASARLFPDAQGDKEHPSGGTASCSKIFAKTPTLLVFFRLPGGQRRSAALVPALAARFKPAASASARIFSASTRKRSSFSRTSVSKASAGFGLLLP